MLKYRVTLLVLLTWAALSAVGYLGKDTIYKNYKTDPAKTPYFVLVFEGIHDGIYPWSGQGNLDELWDDYEILSFLTGEGEEMQQADGEAKEPGENMPQETQATEEAPAVREFCEVDESYFDDAVFIGDSRTVGLRDYGGLDKATFYATVGLNIYDMWTEKFCEVDGEKVTLEEALGQRQFGKVYFQIGINEMGRGNLESFMQQYAMSVQKFRQLQPDAIIYVQGIMRVTKEKSDADKIFNNEGICARNDRIAQLADGQTVFYIDMNDVVCDGQGNLRDDLTFDDLHLLGSKYGIWVDFLKTKGIRPQE